MQELLSRSMIALAKCCVIINEADDQKLLTEGFGLLAGQYWILGGQYNQALRLVWLLETG